MKTSIRKGFSFGLTSGVITTLGLITGLSSSTQSKFIVMGGIISIAIADALSDALGIHISEESENMHTTREIWESTISTFLSKFIFAITFIIPVLFFPLNLAVLISTGWGLLLIAVFSYRIAITQHVSPYIVILEHLTITLIVVMATNWVGSIIASFF